MNELFGRANEGPSMDREVMKALVAKVVELGTQVKEIAEQMKKLTEGMEEIRKVNERLDVQGKQVEVLIGKEEEMMAEIRKATEKMDLPVEKVKLLENTLEKTISTINQPLDKTIRHHHLMGKAFWILLVMSLMCSVTSSTAIWQWQRADRYAADEIRWRAVKLLTDPAVTSAIDQIESSSQADPRGFSKIVVEEEDRREELARNEIREKEARRRIDELQKPKAKK